MRHPLYLEPDAAEAWAAQGLVMLGSDVLFAPVLVEGATTVSVYLPAGDWLRVPTGEALTGGSTHTVSAPLGSPALFVRAGSAVAGELLP
jgi:alpha-glucosidase (family GH31 glycosyl hydrolase)